MDQGVKTRCIFLDIAVAFDAVPHFLLHHKITSYGIQGNLLCLLGSYLNDRSVWVRVEAVFLMVVFQGI
jgi:hypothetical protein